MSKKTVKFPKPKPSRSPFLVATRPQSPDYDQLAKALRELVPNLCNGAFNNFVLVGYRRVPESEAVKYGGQTEVPFYFYHFQDLFPAGALVDWAAEDVKERLVVALLQARRGQGQMPPNSGIVEKQPAPAAEEKK